VKRAAPTLAIALLAGCGGDPTPAPPAALPAPKHVLITLVDACAARHLSVYGYERGTTPFLERLAEESIVFDDVSSASSYTLASTAALMTGSSVELHGVSKVGDVLPDDLPLLAEAFADAGFGTYGLSMNAHVVEAFGFARGFDQFVERGIDLSGDRRMVVPDALLGQLEGFMNEPPSERFFAYWHFLPPHAPYLPPAEYVESMAPGVDEDLAKSMWQASGRLERTDFSAEQLAGIVSLYDATLRYIDDVLARIHAGLESSGLLDETLWIIISDHGEAFGQHGALQHSSSVYQEQVRVPLMMRMPGLEARRVSEPVSLVDLYPTLRELFDLDVPKPPSGVSLAPLLTGQDSVERNASLFLNATSINPMFGLRAGDLKLVHAPRLDSWVLHDLELDPLEERDARGANLEAFEALRAELQARLRLMEARTAGIATAELDAATIEQLRAIGYVDELEGLGVEDPGPEGPDLENLGDG
jgi:arylsulfatase